MSNLIVDAEWRIYASVNYAIIGSDNGLSPVRPQPMISTNDGLLSIKRKETYCNELLIEIQKLLLKKMHLEMSSAKMAAILSRPQCAKLLKQVKIYIAKSKLQIPIFVVYKVSGVQSTDVKHNNFVMDICHENAFNPDL